MDTQGVIRTAQFLEEMIAKARAVSSKSKIGSLNKQLDDFVADATKFHERWMSLVDVWKGPNHLTEMELEEDSPIPVDLDADEVQPNAILLPKEVFQTILRYIA